jgi:uncharacterized GH25 family protein
LDKPARERYSKHVKSLIQVGADRTGGFNTVFGYPAELVALDNPYALGVGASLRLRALTNSEPIANQEVLYGGLAPGGATIAERSARTDVDGNVTIPLSARGTWYVKFVRMFRTRADTVDYVSNWATLTFQLR